MVKLMEKAMEEEKARVPRANPYPYTTDYPVVRKYIYILLVLIVRALCGKAALAKWV